MLFLLSLVSLAHPDTPARPARPPMIRAELSVYSPAPGIILGATSDEGVAVYDLCATGVHPLSLEEFQLGNCVTEEDSDGDCADSGEEPGVDEVVSSLYALYESVDGYAETSYVMLAGGIATFSNANMWIPSCQVGTAPLEIYVDTNATDHGGVPGDEIQFNWTGVDVLATNLVTGRTVTRATQSVVGFPQEYHTTKPTFTLSSTSPTDEVTAEFSTTLCYNVAADAHGYYSQDGILFEVNTTRNDSASATAWNSCEQLAVAEKWEFHNRTDASYNYGDDGEWTFYGQDGLLCEDDPSETFGWAWLNTDSLLEVGAGETESFCLKIDLTGASTGTNPDKVTAMVASYDRAVAYGLSDNLEWRDDDYTAATFGGKYVYNTATGDTLSIVPSSP